MADTPEVHRRMDAYALVTNLEQYASDNRNTRDVNDRWLTDLITREWLPIARKVRDGSAHTSDAYGSQVASFRLAELDAEKTKLAQQIGYIEREAAKLKQRPVSP